MTRFLGDGLSDDVGNVDGAIFIGPQDFAVLTNGTVTRNGVADVSVNQAASLTGTFTFGLNPGFVRRVPALLGTFNPLTNPSGGLLADGTNVVVGDAAVAKGIKITDLTVHYLITVANLTSINIRADRVKFVNNVANAVSAVLANGANGLQTVVQANPYTTKIALTDPVSVSGYDTSDNSGLYVELVPVTPATSLFRLYGFTVHCTYNLD